MVEIAYMSWSMRPHCGSKQTVQLLRLEVAKPFRKQGHGKRTLVWAIQELLRGGADKISVFSPAKKGVAYVCCSSLQIVTHHSDTMV
jgi:hypothetical protein